MRALVAYFSAQGRTAHLAKELASGMGADLFEIRPEKPYSASDLNWTNPFARCNRENLTGRDVPVQTRVEGFEKYDTVLLGFPIWYGCAPNVVNTFCREMDWTGKKVYAFATSGGSGIGKTAEKLRPFTAGAVSLEARLAKSASEVRDWVEGK